MIHTLRRWFAVSIGMLGLGACVAGATAALGADSFVAGSAPNCDSAEKPCFTLESTIAFSSTRDNPAVPSELEVYLMRGDGTNPRRLTNNTDGDGFAALSPDGKKIVFDSNRNRAESEVALCPNVAPVPDPSGFFEEVFLMNTDGTEQTRLTRGDSATWSPDGKDVAFHASASGAGCLTRSNPGAAAIDSDIFVANVDDLLAGVEQPRNITNTSDKIEDDADWSSTPAGERIVYTAHNVGDDIQIGPVAFVSNSAELYLTNPDGSDRLRLTNNGYQESAPDWSPNGEKIVYMCRIDGGTTDLEICVIDAHPDPDGTLPTPTRLTDNSVQDLAASFSPDGQQIVFQRQVPGQGNQLFTMRPTLNPDGTLPTPTQLTTPPGINLFPNWGELRVHEEPAQ